ncbi:anthrone oxygenase family protein [Micromonospora sp. NPDC049366]|uniref:anthrone oxygenase family protein n=1 Tax=Micromonospora sp. NPDC049366 TaxID=3364271 RepID=UPI0037A95D24
MTEPWGQRRFQVAGPDGLLVEVLQAVIDPWFMTTFFGALVSIGVAAVLHLGPDRRVALAWLTLAFVLYLAVVVITIAVHVPLNDAVKAAGDVDRIDVTQVRARFGEARWLAWNHVRTCAAIAAFAILATVPAVT